MSGRVNLKEEQIDTTDDADKAFGVDKGLLVAVINRCNGTFFFRIPSGYYGVVSSNGADIDHPETGYVWPEGLHIRTSPFIQPSRLVTKQSIIYDVPVKEVMTADNVYIEIDIHVVFRIMGDVERGEDPSLVKTFVIDLTPNGLKNQLRSAVEQELLKLGRSIRAHQAYGLRKAACVGDFNSILWKEDEAPGAYQYQTNSSNNSSVNSSNNSQNTSDDEGNDDDDDDGKKKENDEKEEIEQNIAMFGSHLASDAFEANLNQNKSMMVVDAMKASLDRQFNPRGVDIEDIIITDVKLPMNIFRDYTEKTMIQSQNAQQKMIQLSEMQEIEQSTHIQKLEQKHIEERDYITENGEREAKEKQVDIENKKAELQKVIESIQSDTRVKINNIKSVQELELSNLRNEKMAILEESISQAEKKAENIVSTAKMEVEQTISSALLEAAQNDGQASIAIAAAEGAGAKGLRAAKSFGVEMRRLEILDSLAKSGGITISSSTETDLNALLLGDVVLSSNNTDDNLTRSNIVSELAVFKKNSTIYYGAST